MFELAFEKLNVFGYYSSQQLACACYSFGVTDCLALDVGDSLTQAALITPRCSNCTIAQDTYSGTNLLAYEYIGGADVTCYLGDLIK